MTMRDEFEAWARVHLGQGYPLTIEDHIYVSPVTRWAFKAWKAATEAAAKKWEAAIIWGDGVCDDSPGVQTLVDGRPVVSLAGRIRSLAPKELDPAAAIRGKGE